MNQPGGSLDSAGLFVLFASGCRRPDERPDGDAQARSIT
jgi:hypothetical protein